MQTPDASEQQEKAYLEQQTRAAAPAFVAFAVGVTLCLCGGLGLFMESSGRSQGTDGTVVTLLAAGTLLFLAGVGWIALRRRKTAYRITHPLSPTVTLFIFVLAVLAVAVPFGLAALFDNSGVRILAGPLLIVLLPAVVTLHTQLTSALIMNPVAVAVGETRIPWAAVAQVVVTPLGSDRGVEIGVRLRPDSPLPPDTPLPEPVPGDPAAPQARVQVAAGKYKEAEFLKAVARFGPPGIPVIARTPAGEHVIRS